MGEDYWGNVFITTAQDWSRDFYGFSNLGKKWAEVVTHFQVSDSEQWFSFYLNSTATRLWWPPENENNWQCHGLGFCAYAARTDPCCYFYLFPNDYTVAKPTQRAPWSRGNTSVGTLTPGQGSIPAKTVTIKNHVHGADDWFAAVTGISGRGNNWLLMAEEAAKAVKEDCVVCMGPRPTLKIVPAEIDQQCVMELKILSSPHIHQFANEQNWTLRLGGTPPVSQSLPNNSKRTLEKGPQPRAAAV